VRGLGLWSASAVVVGSMIGQAVFLVGSDMAQELGSLTGLLAAWTIGGVLVFFGVCCYAELGAAMPKAGGDYVYLSRGLSPVFGFLFGWTRSMIMSPGMAAVIAAGVLRFVEFLFPAVAIPLFTGHVTLSSQSQPYQFTLTAGQPLAAAVLVLLALSNYLGVRMAGRFQVVLTSLKMAALAAIIIFGMLLGKVATASDAYITLGRGGLGSFLMVLVPVMAAYNGFQSLVRVHWRGDHEPAKEHSTRSDLRVTSRDQPSRAGQLDIFSSAGLVPRRTITSCRLRYNDATHRQQWGEVDYVGHDHFGVRGAPF